MIWDIVNTSSEIDSVFEKENPTLESVLDASDLFDKCHENYLPLINFITQDDIFHDLIKYIIQDHDIKNFDKTQYKYSNVSSELIKTTDATTSKLVAYNDETQKYPYLDFLLDYFSSEKPLNALSASLVCRVLTSSIGFSNQGKNLSVLVRFTTHPTFSKNIFRHTNCGAVIDFLLHMTSIEDKQLHVPLGMVINQEFFHSLTSFFDPHYAPEYYESISYLFSNISINLRRKLSELFSEENYFSEEGKFYEKTLDCLESEDLINNIVGRLTKYHLDSNVTNDSTYCLNREYLAPNIIRIFVSFVTNQNTITSQYPFLNVPKETSNDSSNDKSTKPALDPRIVYQKLSCIRLINAFTNNMDNILKVISDETLSSTELDHSDLPNGKALGYSRICLIQCLQLITSIGIDYKTSPKTYTSNVKTFDENSQTQDSTMSGSSPMQTNEDEITENSLNDRINRSMQLFLESLKERKILTLLSSLVQRFPMNTFLSESFANIIRDHLVHSGYPCVKPYEEDSEEQNRMDFQQRLNLVFTSVNDQHEKKESMEAERAKINALLMNSNEQCLNGLEYIFNDCQLTEFLILMNPVMIFDEEDKLDQANDNEQTLLVAKSIKTPKPGYSGYIWNISNYILTIENFYKSKDDLNTFIKCFQERSHYDNWSRFVNKCLIPINEQSKIEPIQNQNANNSSNSVSFNSEELKNLIKFQSFIKESSNCIGDFIKNLNPERFTAYNSSQDDDALRMPENYQTPSSGKDSASPAPINETFDWAKKPILNSSDLGRTSECSNDDSDESDETPDNTDDSDFDSDCEQNSSGFGNNAPRVITQKKNPLISEEFSKNSTSNNSEQFKTNSNSETMMACNNTNETSSSPTSSNDNHKGNPDCNNQNEDWADFSAVNVNFTDSSKNN